MPKFSIISCVSNFEVYQKCLIESLYRFENTDLYELIPVDNYNSNYTAAQALNLAIKAAKSDLIICCHQDISLLPGFFQRAIKILDDIDDDWGIIGCAGPSLEKDESNNHFPIGRVYAGKVSEYGDDFDSKLRIIYDGEIRSAAAFCVDECLFLINKRQGIRFNPEIDGFHFYGADICLSMMTAGKKVYASYLPIIHHGEFSESAKSGDIEYWRLFKKLLKLWREKFKECYGTHMHWTHLNDDTKGFEISTYLEKTASSHNFSAKVLYLKINEKIT
jgi:GT2 family glycosyltransferase